jgi:zinc protease
MKALPVMVLGLLLASFQPLVAGDQKVSEQNVVRLHVANDPTVSFRIWFRVGSQNDPPGKEGLAEITAAMLTEASTTKNTYDRILEKLFPLAASYSATSSVEMTVVYGRVHTDNLKEYYPLLLDAITTPAFAQRDLDRIKSQSLNFLENVLRYSSDEELGKAVLYNDIFAETPYGHITAGTIQGVKSITVEDVRAFYRKNFTRDNVVIGIGGGYDEALAERLREDLGRLPEGKPVPVPVPTPRSLQGLSVTLVEKDAPATAISMGFPIAALRGTKDWYALAVANSWLGEHRNSSSHLYQVIREQRGLNYGDYSYIENFPRGGMLSKPPQNVSRRAQLFEIWIRPVPNETRHFALRAALREFKRLVENGMTEEEFSLTREFLRKYVLHYAPTTMERLGYALDDRFYGVGGSHLEKFREEMGKVTLADVNAAIKKYWQYGNMHIAAITKDAKGFKDALESDAPSPIHYKTPKPEAVMNEDKEIQAFPLMIKSGNIRIVQLSDLFVK